MLPARFDPRNRWSQRQSLWLAARPGTTGTLIAVGLLLAATLAMLPFRPGIGVLSVGLVYLVVVVLAALLAERRAALALAVAAFAVFDVLFIAPWYTVTVATQEHVLVLLVFLGSALLISHLLSTLRLRTLEALDRGRQMEVLHTLSQSLLVDAERAPLLERVVQQVQLTLQVSTAAVVLRSSLLGDARRDEGEGQGEDRGGGRHVGEDRDQDEMVLAASAGPPPPIMDRDLYGLIRGVQDDQTARGLRGGRRAASGVRVVRPTRTAGQTPTRGASSSSQPWFVVPLSTATTRHGVLVAGRERGSGFDAVEMRLLGTFGNQLALALDRVQLTHDLAGAEALARSDALKSALLSAVSHDLRTPLTSIKASATSLLEPGLTWSAEDQRDLLQAIDEEADRLSRIVTNLLDLSRIEAGVLRPQRAWHDVDAVVADALAATAVVLREHAIRLELAPDLPPLLLDHVQMVQVLTNLLSNAARHAPPGTPVSVAAYRAGSGVEVQVADHGPGFPPGMELRVFEPFVQLATNRPVPGVGIGLAICRGIVEAHGGRIRAANREDGSGAVVTISLPLPLPASAPTAPAYTESTQP